jgi:hypothetical protein
MMHRLAEDANAEEIAVAVCATWRAIDAVLTPILGPKGVAAVYNRCLHLAGATYPWLAQLHASSRGAMDLDALKAVFAQQASADAAAAYKLVLQNFEQLLAGLVGTPLSERLLRSVRPDPPSTGA